MKDRFSHGGCGGLDQGETPVTPPCPPCRSVRNTGGFTFVEILAAMLFLGILMPVVIGALQVSNRSAVLSERSTIAVQLAENQLAELQLDDAWTTASASGDFGADWQDYRWELTKADWANGAMTELQLTAFFTVQGREHDVRLSTLVAESEATTE
jgi:type II secretory pathway pseudopilin PulG